MTEEKEFTRLFEFVLSHLEVFVACRPIQENPEVAGPKGVVGLDYKVGGPVPVMYHHGFIVVDVLAVQGYGFHFGAGDFESGEEAESRDEVSL